MKDNTTDECITIVNLNAWFGLDCRGIFKFGEYESDRIRNARLENLMIGLREIQPDIIGIQKANKLPAHLNKLSKILNLDIVCRKSRGLSILLKKLRVKLILFFYLII